MDQYYPNFRTSTYSLPFYNKIYNNLRQKNEGFDVEIQIVENETVTSFKVHSKLLLMFSPEFFGTLLSERWNTDKKPEVVDKNSLNVTPEVPLRVVRMGVGNVHPEVFSEILDFMYTGSITFRPANIQAVIITAHYLQLTTLHNHAQAYLEQMLDYKPEVGKFQIYKHLALESNWLKKTKLCRFGEKLYAFENQADELLIIVKSIPDDRWMFADSLELVKTENPLEDSDVYVCDRNYIILHQTPTRRLNSLPVTLGNLYYSGTIDRNVYICGSKPLGSQFYNLYTRKFTKFPLPALGFNSFLTYVSPRMIFAVEGGYLNVFEPRANRDSQCSPWKKYKLPHWHHSSTYPMMKIEMPEFNSNLSKFVKLGENKRVKVSRLPDGALAFYFSKGGKYPFYFDTKEKTFNTLQMY